MFQLYPYQQDATNQAFAAWNEGYKNVLIILPTGAGKTVVATNILNQWDGFKLAAAHRQELVSQISLAFARTGVPHRIFGPNNMVSDIRSIHKEEVGKSFVDMQAPLAVGGVNTLRARMKKKDPTVSSFLKQTRVWFQDEAHHVLKTNMWGEITTWCPNAYGLGVTATPLRADGKGLGREYDGLFDHMIVGPNMRDLIDMGFLCDYAPPICPPSDMKISTDDIGSTGDYKQHALKKAARESHIVGDVVQHYQKFAAGKLGITFATDVETAVDIAQAYRDAGIPAECVSGNTPDLTRHQIIKRFRNRELLQLVNVDLFGEGFDLPAIEVISMARPTQSYGLYVQQFGRVLRRMEGKDKAIIIDHVNNVRTHGLPDYGRPWTLERKQKRASRKDQIKEVPRTTCENPECFKVYEAVTKTCPYCGHSKEPANRSAPEFVDGDLIELSPEAMSELRAKVTEVDKPEQAVSKGLTHGGAAPVVVASAAKNHRERQQAQAALRHTIALWAGYWKSQGDDMSMSYRRFYHTFGTDIMSAQALGRPDAEKLQARVASTLEGMI